MDQAGDNCEFRFHQEERARVHCNLGVAAQEYMLFCGCLEDAGYSDLCTYFWLYLSSEYVDGRYPYLIVDHPHFCENMESSAFTVMGGCYTTGFQSTPKMCCYLGLGSFLGLGWPAGTEGWGFLRGVHLPLSSCADTGGGDAGIGGDLDPFPG